MSAAVKTNSRVAELFGKRPYTKLRLGSLRTISPIIYPSFTIQAPAMTNVLFLRDPSRSPVDLYELAFKSSEYNPVSVPVLETVLINLDSLKSIVRDGPVRENYAGVIITSARACEAWKTVTRHLVESSSIEESKTTGR